MGGGGGGQPTSTSQTTIPEYAKPYMESLLGRAASATIGAPVKDPETGEITFGEEPKYQTYDGQRLSDPSQTQLIARQNIRGLDPTGGFQQGIGLTQDAVAGIQGIPTQFTGDMVSQYMSPYMQNVVDVQKRKAAEDMQRTQLNANLGAATQGTLGGSRQALMQGLREQQLGQQLSDIQASGQQAAYDSAMAQLERDRGARFSQSQGIADLGSRIAGLSEADLQSRLGLFGAQEGLGAKERADQQALLTQGYEDFLTQQRSPFTRLGFLSDALRGSSNLAQTGGSAVYKQAAAPYQDLADAGLNALALYKGLS